MRTFQGVLAFTADAAGLVDSELPELRTDSESSDDGLNSEAGEEVVSEAESVDSLC